MKVVVVVAWLIQWNCLTPAIGLKECKRISACSCSTDEGIIDLTKTKSSFKDIKDANDAKPATYTWSPCKPMDEQACQDTACIYGERIRGEIAIEVCLEHSVGVINFLPIGEFKSANCELSTSGQCALTYTGRAYPGTKSTVKVNLECEESEEGRVDPVKSDDDFASASTTLHSKYACFKAKLSIGSILLIIFFSLLFVYITAGILFNKYSKGASGREVFPNYSFWSDFPSLVKDGTVLTFRQCAKLCHLRKYSEI